MLQNPCKTLGFKKNVVYKIPPGGGGKPYPASGLKINTFTIYKGSNSPQEPKKSTKMEFFFSFLHQILHTRGVDSPVMMWIQICARVSGGMLPGNFVLKWCNLEHSECSKISYYQPKNQQF